MYAPVHTKAKSLLLQEVSSAKRIELVSFHEKLAGKIRSRNILPES